MNDNQTGLLLVIDDDQNVLELVKQALSEAAVEVHCATSGNEAAEKLRALDPNLILVDFWLPDCNGIQLVGRLRNAEQLNGARVVCWISAELEPVDALFAHELDIDIVSRELINNSDFLLDLVRDSAGLRAIGADQASDFPARR